MESGYKPNESQLEKIQKKSNFERDLAQLQEAVAKCQISTPTDEQK